ncbi:UDP-3-O-acyl-N-acetylglucosamine deacetylase [Enterovirga aerilata]|uniref:UDP-3-O-acyl-N-acetylglucosamine deacetylase n=1 Tax=Enterovirga aerilata TaxID=2730920 RepID=A0A849I0B7_9HYPH|nr:UDP-3-O-acyl-N-acetylglucosamine deacetylase [Enterovirga sp. DB1703]NNM70851.1 UDP-3-O-acyl-N-acetylglucosamine deacetylase [Enterovirga sp. DB1703]
MKQSQQATLAAPVSLSGIGVHSGKPVNLHLHPAQPNHGIVFLRTGLPGGDDRLIDARSLEVTATELCTVVGDRETGAVATIEHLMSCLRGLGIDNLLVEIDGPEVPIFDGSAQAFVEAIDSVGVVQARAARKQLKVLRTVRVELGIGWAELRPNSRGFQVDVEIKFDNPVIGRQRKVIDLSPAAYRREIARARTFGFIGDVEKLWKAGFALGASLDNTVAIGEGRVINPEGLRFADEFVRHKMLDAIGDLALAGYPILGTYKSFCGGHRLNIAVLKELLSDRANYAIVDGETRREAGHAEIASGVAVPAFAPDVH